MITGILSYVLFGMAIVEIGAKGFEDSGRKMTLLFYVAAVILWPVIFYGAIKYWWRNR
jgi:hypothetical protein